MNDEESRASRFARDMAANAEKIFKATQLIANTRDEDVNIGTTPKHLVMRRDKVELFRYESMAAATAKTPVLLAYGLIGRYTMATSPGRSLVRSLPSRLGPLLTGQPPNRTLATIDDWWMITSMPPSTALSGHRTIGLRFLASARAVFTTCYAALHRRKYPVTPSPRPISCRRQGQGSAPWLPEYGTQSRSRGHRQSSTYGVLPGSS